MSDWMPIDRATIDHAERYWISWKDQRQKPTLLMGSEVRQYSKFAVAVMECAKPEHFVPPKPSRREVSVDFDGFRMFRSVREEYPLFREVLPGDCAPDVVREVVKEMRERAIGGNEILLKYWADRLEGKQ
jgi:hypothetical protein